MEQKSGITFRLLEEFSYMETCRKRLKRLRSKLEDKTSKENPFKQTFMEKIRSRLLSAGSVSSRQDWIRSRLRWFGGDDWRKEELSKEIDKKLTERTDQLRQRTQEIHKKFNYDRDIYDGVDIFSEVDRSGMGHGFEHFFHKPGPREAMYLRGTIERSVGETNQKGKVFLLGGPVKPIKAIGKASDGEIKAKFEAELIKDGEQTEPSKLFDPFMGFSAPTGPPAKLERWKGADAPLKIVRSFDFRPDTDSDENELQTKEPTEKDPAPESKSDQIKGDLSVSSAQEGKVYNGH